MTKKYYLAYGSNMNVEQMSRRCPDATVEGKAILKGYELVFMGRQESAVANILPAEKSVTPVVIWSISNGDEKSLDIYEGYPRLYIKKNIRVKLNGKEISAMAYIMTDGHKYGKPNYHYYKVIAEGYTHFKFDFDYLKQAVLRSDRRAHSVTDNVEDYIQHLSEEQQSKYNPVCPRCGISRMKPRLSTNALSRRADIYVCDFCGTDEALRDALGYKDDVKDWYAIKRA